MPFGLSATPSAEHLALDPDWQPFAYEAKRDTLVFAHLPREAQRRLIFLDRRFTQDRPKTGPVPIGTLPREAIRAQAAPLHFIFHTAFCCSTLLTRALDIPGAAMGLKEPEILGSFADAMQAHPNDLALLSSLNAALNLLSRPLSAGETQIVKASNLVNTIVPHLLDVRPGAKAIIMHSTLETYLRATARRMLAGRAFNREALLLFQPVMPLSADMTHDVMLRLTDLEIAAVVWLMQVRFLSGVAAAHGPSRVRTLWGRTLLGKPAETLERAGAFSTYACRPQPLGTTSPPARSFASTRRRTAAPTTRKGARPILKRPALHIAAKSTT